MVTSKLIKNKKVAYTVSAIFIALILAGGFLFYKGFSFMNAIKSKHSSKSLKKPNNNENINILLVGIDAGKFVGWNRTNDIGRTDTIIVASLNQKTKKITITSVPRDSRVKLKGKYDKINAAYGTGGIDLSIQSVSDLLGIPIHHYVQLNYESFSKIVNILNGVTVYVDPGIKNSINIPTNLFTPGVQTLKGDKAFYFVQARNSDLDRVQRQQVFLKAVFNEIKKPGNTVKIPQILDAVKDDIKTDMTATEILSLSTDLEKLSPENIQTSMIPGTPQYIDGVSYYLPDNDKIKVLIKNEGIQK